jgi:glycosyltransferase involved in cell wall biosynthesis
MAQSNGSHTISIIVPTYNEKETIISFLERVTHQISKNNFDTGIIVWFVRQFIRQSGLLKGANRGQRGLVNIGELI